MIEVRPHSCCHLCGESGLLSFYRIERVPVRSIVLCPTREIALGWPRGTIDLVACPHCGFIQNDAYDPAHQDFSASAEETQGFSPRFRQFSRLLAEDLAGRYPLEGGLVVEIGCGRGEFLAMICETSEARGIGIDPSLAAQHHSDAAGQLEYIPDRFENHLEVISPADLIVCRHTLEHIQPVRPFMRTLREALPPAGGTPIVFEVPECGRILRELAFWDIYYEHCSYFTAGSLQRLFHDTGFRVTRSRTGFDGQYLIAEARSFEVGIGTQKEPGDIVQLAGRFAAEVSRSRQGWQNLLRRCRQKSQRVVLWGSGSKAVAFLSMMAETADAIDYIVDINPRKQGTWSPGTGHPIVAPDVVAEQRPDLIMVMNPVYLEEIRQAVQTRGVHADFLALGAAEH